MVGQNKNKEIIDSLLKNNSFPQTILILGPIGSGRKTLSEYIKTKLGISKVIDIVLKNEYNENDSVKSLDNKQLDNSVQSVRNIIATSNYLSDEKLMMRFNNFDTLSYRGKGALLKAIETPNPKTTYVMIGSNIKYIPDTILSRSFVFNMESYTKNDFKEYNNKIDPIILDVATNIGEIKQLEKVEDIKKVYGFAEKIIDNIPTNSEFNMYKIGTYIKQKESDKDKFEFDCLLLCMLKELEKRMLDDHKNATRYKKYSVICNKYIDNYKKTTATMKKDTDRKLVSNFTIDEFIWELKKCN